MLYSVYVLLLLFFSPLSYAGDLPPPPIQLATIYHPDIKIEKYWVSEKLDGVRAYWNGQQLISKQGNIFHAPDWFIKDFPIIPLDGELWIGRNQFEKVSSITRKQNATDQEWQQVSFMIFDMPGSYAHFTARLAVLEKLIELSDSPYLKLIKQQQLQSNEQLQSLLEEVLAQGGEGLMLHKADAYYQVARSKDLLKLKKQEDAEAVVIQHLPGKGRNSGRLGALLVETETGIRFRIGTGFSDQERENPPPVGATITYTFSGKTKNNVPRFASYKRIREIY
ncbi:DNA ligase [Psychromonas sp.]|uniref:DNA ligase n=1 Tax=Psychromonas sp. TaxID=1884585 RepID=UPI0035618D86